MEKVKCKYCGKEITPGSIRCTECDIAWNDGYHEGAESIKNKLREIVYAIRNFIAP